MRILYASAEVTPFSKTGGLGDVAGALPAALARRGNEVLVLSPLYGCVDRERHGLRPSAEFSGGRLWEAPSQGRLRHAFVESAEHFDRPGIYGEKGDYPDNAARFISFSRRLLPAARALDVSPDVLHLNDWQTAAATHFARRAGGPPSVLTIHNLGYQGLFPLAEAGHLFDAEAVSDAWIHHGQLALLKGGIVTADLVTTVSPTYAREIRETELGFGLGDELRARGDRLVGILNGIDTDAWDPARDPHLPAPFHVGDRGGKRECKRALGRELGLEAEADVLLLGMVSRIVGQKGFDILVPALDQILEMPVELVILGDGDPAIEEALEAHARRHPGRLALRFAFDEGLARRIYAGADAFLMPSAYEPCGLSQLYALRYGALPVVRATGGLRDTVQDGETGFVFEAYEAEAMVRAIARAVSAFGRSESWEAMVERGMREDHSWDRSAAETESVYAEIFCPGGVAPQSSTW